MARPKLTPVPPTKEETWSPEPEPKALDVILSAFAALGYALSVRALLLLALLGGFALAAMAMAYQTVIGLSVLAAYAILVLLPLVVLEVKRRG